MISGRDEALSSFKAVRLSALNNPTSLVNGVLIRPHRLKYLSRIIQTIVESAFLGAVSYVNMLLAGRKTRSVKVNWQCQFISMIARLKKPT